MDKIPSSSHTPPVFHQYPDYGGLWPEQFHEGRHDQWGDRISALSPPRFLPETADAIQQPAMSNQEAGTDTHSDYDQAGLHVESSRLRENPHNSYSPLYSTEAPDFLQPSLAPSDLGFAHPDTTGFPIGSSYEAESRIYQYPSRDTREVAHGFPQPSQPYVAAYAPAALYPYPTGFHAGSSHQAQFPQDHIPFQHVTEPAHNFPQSSGHFEATHAPAYSHPYPTEFQAGSSHQAESHIDHFPAQQLSRQEKVLIDQFLSVNCRSRSVNLTSRLRTFFAEYPNTKFSLAQLQTHFPETTEKLSAVLRNLNVYHKERCFPTLTLTPMTIEEAHQIGRHRTGRPYWYSLETGSAKP